MTDSKYSRMRKLGVYSALIAGLISAPIQESYAGGCVKTKPNSSKTNTAARAYSLDVKASKSGASVGVAVGFSNFGDLVKKVPSALWNAFYDLTYVVQPIRMYKNKKGKDDLYVLPAWRFFSKNKEYRDDSLRKLVVPWKEGQGLENVLNIAGPVIAGIAIGCSGGSGGGSSDGETQQTTTTPITRKSNPTPTPNPNPEPEPNPNPPAEGDGNGGPVGN